VYIRVLVKERGGQFHQHMRAAFSSKQDVKHLMANCILPTAYRFGKQRTDFSLQIQLASADKFDLLWIGLLQTRLSRVFSIMCKLSF